MDGQNGRRLWVTTLSARAAFRFEERHQITLHFSDAEPSRVAAVRLRNTYNWATDDHSEGAPKFIGGFVCEGAGQCSGAEEAVRVLGNAASPFFQALAIAANAGVEEAEDVVAYSPPSDPADEGRFHIQRHSLPLNGKGKHDLALALGFTPKRIDDLSFRARIGLRVGGLSPANLKSDRSHLGRLDGHIRLAYIFDNDEECYKQLKDMSDGFEHGYMDLGDVQTKSKMADRAFTHVRKSILNEVGVPEASPLRGERFEKPLGVWRPVFEGAGGYTDSDPPSIPSFTPGNINQAWPDPIGLSLVPSLIGVVDHDDGSRSLTLRVNGVTSGLTPTQQAFVRTTQWLGPTDSTTKPVSQQTTVTLNGEVVEDTIDLPSGDETTE